MFNIEKKIRELAKQQKWQLIYSAAKELNINLFKNNNDYSYSQILFLNYLAFYSSLNLDIYISEVSEIVLKSEIYEDGYQAYKNSKDKKEKLPVLKNPKQENLEDNPKSTRWIFSRPPKQF